MKRRISGRRILITGASSGIGRALALQLAESGNRLLLTARRADRLEELAEQIRSQKRHADSQVEIVVGDIADRSLQKSLMDRTSEAYQGLDILINNAGMGGIGTYASADESRLRRIMEVNFFAPAELIRLALPLLRQSDDAIVVNMGSVLGHCAVPKKSEYSASKFAMHGFTDALRMELADEKIDVILISPSTTSSEFFEQSMRSEGKAAKNNNPMSPETVARKSIKAMEQGRREVILSVSGNLLVWLNRLLPDAMSWVLKKYA